MSDEPGGGPAQITVVIVDDHALLREGTRRILERDGGFAVLAEAAEGDEALTAIGQHRPDVVLLDVRMPGMNGVEVARRISQVAPGSKVLMLSAFDEVDYVQAALSAGVAGYLLKTTPGNELCGAIRAAHAGVTVLDPKMSANLLGRAGETRALTGIDSLTLREREVVRLVAEGLANKEIAQRLGISPRTVEGHLNHIFDKVGATSRSSLVRLAMVNGLVDSS